MPTSPGGAFYIYAGIPDGEGDSPALARRLLAETGVTVTPGVDFDLTDGSRFVRFGYAGATSEIKEAIRRLESWRR